MDAELIGTDEDGILVTVTDGEGYEYVVAFDWDGELLRVAHDRFDEDVDPDSEAARTLTRVQERARREAHRETDATLLDDGDSDLHADSTRSEPTRSGRAELLEVRAEDGLAVVEVRDRRDNQHLLEVALEDGEVVRHGQDAYPDGPEDRTDDQERIMFETDVRARYELHRETDYDVLGPGWDPEVLERGIEAVRDLSTAAFADGFEDYYRALRDPARIRREFGIVEGEVAFDGEPELVMVQKGFCIRDGRVTEVVDGVYPYYTGPGEERNYAAGDPPTCSAGETLVTSTLPPFEAVDDDYQFPEDFRELVVNNLVCQVRDVYRNMGEAPPDRFDVEGVGKPVIVADVEW